MQMEPGAQGESAVTAVSVTMSERNAISHTDARSGPENGKYPISRDGEAKYTNVNVNIDG